MGSYPARAMSRSWNAGFTSWGGLRRALRAYRAFNSSGSTSPPQPSATASVSSAKYAARLRAVRSCRRPPNSSMVFAASSMVHWPLSYRVISEYASSWQAAATRLPLRRAPRAMTASFPRSGVSTVRILSASRVSVSRSTRPQVTNRSGCIPPPPYTANTPPARRWPRTGPIAPPYVSPPPIVCRGFAAS